MKKGFRKVCAALCSTALLCAATAVPASASTVSDVIAAAYAVGIPAQYVQEYKNRLKNEKFKAAEIAEATGSEISLMTTTANNPLKPTVTYFRKSSCFMQFIWPVVCHT